MYVHGIIFSPFFVSRQARTIVRRPWKGTVLLLTVAYTFITLIVLRRCDICFDYFKLLHSSVE